MLFRSDSRAFSLVEKEQGMQAESFLPALMVSVVPSSVLLICNKSNSVRLEI